MVCTYTYIQIRVITTRGARRVPPPRGAETGWREKRRIERGVAERITAETGVIDAADSYRVAAVEWWWLDCGLRRRRCAEVLNSRVWGRMDAF